MHIFLVKTVGKTVALWSKIRYNSKEFSLALVRLFQKPPSPCGGGMDGQGGAGGVQMTDGLSG